MGLDFFYLSVDFFDNDKVLLVEQEYDSRATLLAIKLLGKIYHKGFYYKWGKDECLLFTRKLPADYTAEFVQSVVDALVERGFFHKEYYEKQGVLTSESIQLHYFEAVQRRKRVEVEPDYLLVDVKKYKNVHVAGEDEQLEEKCESAGENGLNASDVYILPSDVDISCENVDISKQSKGKESKLKVEERKTPPSNPPEGKLRSVEDIFSSIPRDGAKRNCEGLVENLCHFGAKEEEIIRLVVFCNYGIIGHPVWQAITDIRNAAGKIHQPVSFIWSQLRKSKRT
ncbi:DUF4373 domain-containing protein [Bacteroides rodentium]